MSNKTIGLSIFGAITGSTFYFLNINVFSIKGFIGLTAIMFGGVIYANVDYLTKYYLDKKRDTKYNCWLKKF